MNGSQRGIALAIVLWFIAGMTLLVAGIVANARVDTRTTQVHLAKAKAVAAGDGAIRLAMLERLDGDAAPAAITESAYRIGELDVRVRIYPASGFVNMNTASVEMMAALFSYTAGLSGEEARAVAGNVVNWRENRGEDGSGGGQQNFYSPEDMLRVDGMTRTLLDAIRDYSVAGNWASGGMDGAAAPQELQQVIGGAAGGQADTSRKGGNRRNAVSSGSSGLAAGGVYRADALVDYGGRTWLRRRWLSMGSQSDSRLPWQVVRTEMPRVQQEIPENKG